MGRPTGQAGWGASGVRAGKRTWGGTAPAPLWSVFDHPHPSPSPPTLARAPACDRPHTGKCCIAAAPHAGRAKVAGCMCTWEERPGGAPSIPDDVAAELDFVVVLGGVFRGRGGPRLHFEMPPARCSSCCFAHPAAPPRPLLPNLSPTHPPTLRAHQATAPCCGPATCSATAQCPRSYPSRSARSASSRPSRCAGCHARTHACLRGLHACMHACMRSARTVRVASWAPLVPRAPSPGPRPGAVCPGRRAP